MISRERSRGFVVETVPTLPNPTMNTYAEWPYAWVNNLDYQQNTDHYHQASVHSKHSHQASVHSNSVVTLDLCVA